MAGDDAMLAALRAVDEVDLAMIIDATLAGWSARRIARAMRLRPDLVARVRVGAGLLDRPPGAFAALESRPLPDPAPRGPARRACLRCGADFASAGAHNRLCGRCGRASEPWLAVVA